MTGMEIFIIIAVALGVVAVLASIFISENTLTTKKEKQRLEEKEAKAKEEFDKYLETQMNSIKEKIEKYEVETFSTLTKNASHDIEVAANEAVKNIGDRTDEVKKQIDELFENAKAELETLDRQYLEKLDERNKEANAKADEILEKSLKDLELVKEDAGNLVSSLEKACFESADKAAKDAIDELDIISVFKELYEKSTLHKKGPSKEDALGQNPKIQEEEKEISEAEVKNEYETEEKASSEPVKVAEEECDEKDVQIADTVDSNIEKATEEEISTDSDGDKEITEISDVPIALDTEDLEVIEAVIQAGDEMVKEQEIIEIKELAKQFEEMDFEVSEEEIEKIKEKENLTNDKKDDNILDLSETGELEKTKILPKIEQEFVFVEEELPLESTEDVIIEDAEEPETAPVTEEVFEELPEEENMLFKVMRENDIFSSNIDETIVSEVLKMNKKRKTSMQISKELGIGIAEVRTIIDLFS